MGSKKGFSYERNLCTRLSLWWSDGKSEDWFWRTSGSGGRATRRAKKGKSTTSQEGDITFTHPKGKSLIDLVTIEAKKGYPKASLAQIIDRPTSINIKQQEFEKFISKTIAVQKRIKVPFWWIIHKRDRREEMIYVNKAFFAFMESNSLSSPDNYVMSNFPVNMGSSIRMITIVGFRFEEFLQTVSPCYLRRDFKNWSAIHAKRN
jgi:hypothetical protein